MSETTGFTPKNLEEALEFAMVPTAPLIRVLRPLISPYDLTPYRALCRWERGQEYTRFNTADETLCHLGVPQLWREDPELRDLYYRVNLSDGYKAPKVDTHCRNGHERTPENTGIQNKPNGRVSKRCLVCNREADRRYRERHGLRINEGRREKKRLARGSA